MEKILGIRVVVFEVFRFLFVAMLLSLTRKPLDGLWRLYGFLSGI